MTSPVLIIGGAGNVGRRTADTLRALYPALGLVIAGRDGARAAAAAHGLGNATAEAIDLSRSDLGIPAGLRFSAVLMFVKDTTGNALRFAQDRGAAYVDISTGPYEIAPEVAQFARWPSAAPVVLASHWLAGAASHIALHAARGFASLRSIAIAAVIDEHDLGGPAAFADFERAATASPSALVRDDGSWRWLASASDKRRFRDGSGAEHEGTPYSMMDNLTLAAATGARSVRFDLSVAASSSRLRGEPLSTEIIVELDGSRPGGSAARERHELLHPAGQAPVTAAGVALVVERLLGLHGGAAVGPGLYTPDLLVEPAHALRRLAEFGARLGPAR